MRDAAFFQPLIEHRDAAPDAVALYRPVTERGTTAAAAKEIKILIDDSVLQVGSGTSQVQQAGKSMSDMVESVRRVSEVVSEITAASQEQSVGIEEVNRAVIQMDQVTQQNAALVEEAAAAAAAMQEQSANLATVVSVFRLA